jgi:murein DD-endopeptidase MepM/ murein hydrolase activator NlpD
MVAPIAGAEVVREFGTPGPDWQASYHTGRDYRAAPGTTVRSTMAGKVVRVSADDGYGLFVVVQTSGVRHLYGHLSEVSVTVAEQVEAGQVLGLSGEPHLHYEERVSPWGYADHRWPLFDTVGRDGPLRRQA